MNMKNNVLFIAFRVFPRLYWIYVHTYRLLIAWWGISEELKIIYYENKENI
jgi:hypothetical protein